jgi:beta-galactosidase
MKSWLASALLLFSLAPALPLAAASDSSATSAPKHTFAIGEKDFLLDGKPLQIRCGEIHFARVPREYWRNRLETLKAMGLNAVCAYLFWNFHEFEKGKFDWSEQRDVAEFCRIAQEVGLWVVLRPGPYACAEWDGGGLPWWLLKNPDIRMRSQDPEFLSAATKWLKEVGRVLGPLQITHGGPILMVQAENEYGLYGADVEYMGKIRQALLDAGFDVPLFACDPRSALAKGYREDLFQVVNLGRDPKSAFARLREVQPKGPLMSGEFYPGWFDTWGARHHLGDTKRYLGDLETMLSMGASFSIYMAHGGTSFGLWAGANRPFKPDTSSYDYDAPVSEAGWVGEKFELTRDLIRKYLAKGETLPEPPARLPVATVPAFPFTEIAPVFANLPQAVKDKEPRNMEDYDQGHGCTVYRTTLPAGPAATLSVGRAHDFAWVFVDGKEVGMMDRRHRTYTVDLPERAKPVQLDILVEAMGHVNFGTEIHDRKGLASPVVLRAKDGAEAPVEGPWDVFPLRLDAPELAGLKWEKTTPGAKTAGPAFWRGTFEIEKPADTFLDLRKWGKGVVWVNGHCLARYWNIGPTQTAYLPGVWLKPGRNEVVILDLVGPEEPVAAGLNEPILDELRLDLDRSRPLSAYGKLKISGVAPLVSGSFAPGEEPQEVKFEKPVNARQVCFEAVDSHDGRPVAAVAEIDFLDAGGRSIPHTDWSIAYADSEEGVRDDGAASNAIDGQVANYWITEFSKSQPAYPHQLVIDFGNPTEIAGFRYVPKAGEKEPGRIKNYRIFVGDALAGMPQK